jgi:hypothetical protein
MKLDYYIDLSIPNSYNIDGQAKENSATAGTHRAE